MNKITTFRATNVQDLDEEQIRGKEDIQQVTEQDDEGRTLQETSFLPDGSVEHIYKYVYNASGLMVDELLLDEDNEVSEHRSMEYDDSGRLGKEYIHYLDGTADEIVFSYDQEGRIISKKTTDSDGEAGNYIVIGYEGDRLVSEIEYDIDGEVLTRRQLIYNDAGSVTEEIVHTPEEYYRHMFDFDEKGRPSVRRRYDTDSRLMERNTYTYDEDGQLLETMDESASGVQTTFLTYDSAGNVILQEEKTEEGELRSHIDRTYDESNRLLTTTVFIDRPGQQIVPQHYRIRYEYT